MKKTKIEWCDYTWNPVEGCSWASPGCDHCYAAAMARRFHRPWGKAVFRPEVLDDPLHLKKPAVIFVCSTSDVFQEDVENEAINGVLEIIKKCPQHSFVILTKRPMKINALPDRMMIGTAPPNLFVGVSAENDHYYAQRVYTLMEVRWLQRGQRIVSVEPMLGPVSIKSVWPLPDWVICGPETGAGKRPCDPAWIDALGAECAELGVPFFDKRPGAKIRQFPAGIKSSPHQVLKS